MANPMEGEAPPSAFRGASAADPHGKVHPSDTGSRGDRGVLKALFLDRDGVINREVENGYVTKWELFEFLPGVLDALTLVQESGLLAIIVTNQSCINRGLVSKEEIERIHMKMNAEIERHGGKISAIYVCPHTPDEGCACRKPRAGLLEQAMKDFDLKPDEVLFIGDHDRDKGAAEAAGCRFEMVRGDRRLLGIVGTVLTYSA